MVTRRLNLGGTLLSYQALINGEIGMYPEYTGTIAAEILKERPSSDPAQALERSRIEMRRLAQAEVLDPLWHRQRFRDGGVRAEDAINHKGQDAKPGRAG